MAQDAGESLFRTIDTITKKAIQDSNFDKTIKATIVSCVDPTIGKYKVKYQDGYWYAYSENIGVIYPKGTTVYISIPEGNFSNQKMITGAIDRVGIDIYHIQDDSQRYIDYGYNVLEQEGQYNLCSYDSGYFPIDIVDGQLVVGLSIPENFINQLREQNCFKISADVKTQLPPIHINNDGNYGIQVSLKYFRQNLQGNQNPNYTIDKVYRFDVNSFEGNPYVFKNYTHQQQEFIIDNENLYQVNYIRLFVEDFIPDKNPQTAHKADIFIKNISISPCHLLTDEQKNGVFVRIIKTKGNLFGQVPDKEKKNPDYIQRPLIAEVRINGKVVNTNEQHLDFYWFRANPSVTTESLSYCKYGGTGWECINPYEDLQGKGHEYAAAGATYVVTLDQMQFSQQAKYKCVVVYNRKQYSSNQVVMKNTAAQYKVYVQSDRGQRFSLGEGFPTLTCSVLQKGQEENENPDNFIYRWQRQDQNGYCHSIVQVPADNVRYANIISLLNDLNNDDTLYQNVNLPNPSTWLTRYKDIFGSTITDITKKQAIANLESAAAAGAMTQRVQGNVLHNVQMNQVTGAAIFRCGVYSKTQRGQIKDFIGAAAITLVNTDSPQAGYKVVINNGTQVFKYNQAGISPVAVSIEQEKEFEIPELSFTIYDQNRNPISDLGAMNSDIRWTIPSTYTMLKYQYDEQIDKQDSINGEYYHYQPTLSYSIDDNYNINYDRNMIRLEVNYGGMLLSAQTNFTFLKTGQNGTNGTDFSCKIDVNSDIQPYYPTVYLSSTNTIIGSNWGNLQVNGRLYKDNQQVNDPNDPNIFTILKTGYKANDNKNGLGISQSKTEQVLGLNPGEIISNYVSTDPINNGATNIIRLEHRHQQKSYFATLPIVVVKGNFENNDTGYRLNIKPNTGFKSAMYSSDGLYPQYDNRLPFTAIVEQKVNGTWEDISQMGVKNNSRKVTFNWNCRNNIEMTSSQDNHTSQAWFKPASKYDGVDTNNGVYCQATVEGYILEMYIPIALYLNRYGQGFLNDWDGNSIQINENNGVILSPIVGAGQKDNQNNFTGVLMGSVQETDKKQIGLFGYNKGQRSIFLDSQTGKAEFGPNNGGRIVIDPSKVINTNDKTVQSEKVYKPAALLYSNDFPINDFLSMSPRPDVSKITNGSGLIIDLTTPQIGFGNKNFYVTKDGYIHAQGGGQIAGWIIGDQKIYKGETGMRSTSQTNDISVPTPQGNVNKSRAFYAGTTNFKNRFYVTHDGYLRTEQATIGKGTNLIYVGSSTDNANAAIHSFDKVNKNTNADGFYLGVDGIGLGKQLYGTGQSAFQVDNDGTVWMTTGHIGTSNGGWHISDNKLYTGNKDDFNRLEKGLFLSPEGISLGATNAFYVKSTGYMQASSGKIGGWTLSGSSLVSEEDANGHKIILSSDGSISANYKASTGTGWYISSDGKANFYDGTIGGWTIGANSLTGGTLTLNKSGAISGKKWNITADGKATFENINVTGGDWTGGSITGGSFSPSGVGISGTSGGLGSFVGGMGQDLADSNASILCLKNIFVGGSAASATVSVADNGKISVTNPAQLTDYSFHAGPSSVSLGKDLDCGNNALTNVKSISLKTGHDAEGLTLRKITVTKGLITNSSEVKLDDYALKGATCVISGNIIAPKDGGVCTFSPGFSIKISTT